MSNQAEHPNDLYGVIVGALVVLALATAHLPALQISHYLAIPFRAYVSGVLMLVAAIGTLITYKLQSKALTQPWKTPQSQVTVALSLTSICALLGILLQK